MQTKERWVYDVVAVLLKSGTRRQDVKVQGSKKVDITFVRYYRDQKSLGARCYSNLSASHNDRETESRVVSFTIQKKDQAVRSC